MRDINRLQTNIMLYIKWWCENNKTPVPQKAIIKAMGEHGVKSYTALFSINSLIRKGYIRRAIYLQANKTFYVMIRGISQYAEYDFSQFE